MAVKFRFYQDKRKNSRRNGYWYARAVTTNVVEVKDLAQRISTSCTVTESDILAVVSALVAEMSYHLKNGERVKLNGLGSFRVAFSSRGVAKLADFNVERDIHSPRILFLPETQKAGKNRVKNMLVGMKTQELDEYQAGMEPKKSAEKPASAGASSTSESGDSNTDL